MIDEATLASYEALSNVLLQHESNPQIPVSARELLFLIAAARERDGLRDALANQVRHALDLQTALESQRQATEEAMRRVEEARRELADWKRVHLLDAQGRPHAG